MDIFKVVLTSLFSVFSIFVIEKLLGHKEISELNFFDYVNGITIGSIAAELATEIENPIKPFIALTVFGAISMALNFITQKFTRSRKYVNGSPTIIMDDGKLFRENMKKSKLNLSDFLVQLRELGYFNLEDVETAVFECNGKLTVLPKADRKPLTARDVGLKMEKEKIFTELILDGAILGENLKRLGLDEEWLNKELSLSGASPREVFLCLADKEKKLKIYKTIDK